MYKLVILSLLLSKHFWSSQQIEQRYFAVSKNLVELGIKKLSTQKNHTTLFIWKKKPSSEKKNQQKVVNLDNLD